MDDEVKTSSPYVLPTGAIFSKSEVNSSTELAFKYAVHTINRDKGMLPDTTLMYDIHMEYFLLSYLLMNFLMFFDTLKFTYNVYDFSTKIGDRLHSELTYLVLPYLKCNAKLLLHKRISKYFEKAVTARED
uniref:Receptor ligand binding region domain-containing protein n=1 Tax=Glossina austeni TaxID=7395 RepID=A0A1A9VAG2_GLOAU